MRINFAHMGERGNNGHWINFVVFDARSSSGTDDDNASLLFQLTLKARAMDLKVDQSVLAYTQHGQTRYYGDTGLVEYLSRMGPPRQWTHWLEQ